MKIWSRQLGALGCMLFSAIWGCAACTVAFGAEGLKITEFVMRTTDVKGDPYVFTEAGGHPYALTTRVTFNTEALTKGEEVPVEDPRDVLVDLPPGLLGNPQATSRCALETFVRNAPCPASTQVGTVVAYALGQSEGFRGVIYNVVPEKGESAEFGIETSLPEPIALTAHVVRTPSGYGLTVGSDGIPMSEFRAFELTFWGVPADPSHDSERGLISHGKTTVTTGGEHDGEPERPFLTMPADCAAGPVSASIELDSWQKPGVFAGGPSATLPAMTGCDALTFGAGIAMLPDTTQADSPVGLSANVEVPQRESITLPGTPQLRNAVVTLPAGLSINPGVVDGVQACHAFGPEGINISGPESEQLGPNGEPQLAPGHCPDSSTVGTAEAVTPLLGEPVKGHVYLARPGCGGPGEIPCTEEDAVNGTLYKLYLELGGVGVLADAGVNIKVQGSVSANPATGQLTTSFLNNPQLPFSDLKIDLNGGPRASLANPQQCGEARTTADFTPWSAPGTTPAPESLFQPGTPDATPSSFYNVTGCGGQLGLSPGFLAGTVTPTAGAYSPFTMTLTRKDGEQDLSGVQVHTPSGLLGMLASVPLCSEPQADEGTCPEASRIGTTMVASGAGSHPFEIGGRVYLTGPYDGAPFGLSIVTNAVAGPFNLGLIVVRAKIDVDPTTSELTVTTDTTGAHKIPQIVFGVPLRLQRVTVDIDRPHFMFNPTNCHAQRITAMIAGEQGASAQVQSPFAVGACKTLTFKPKFTVSTSGRTSRKRGASLDAKLSFPSLPPGEQANVGSVKVSLPRLLPSRLSTLQQACAAATFAEDPAACPRASVVGVARTTTPLLPVQLSGPVYFVSHGGEAFPNLIIVLQGDNVRVDLVGDTFISKAGITSSTFKTIPDVPVRSFELYLPEGVNSALAANGGLCKQAGKLIMPTEMRAQNGTVFRQRTKIKVVGCSKPARTAKASRRGKAGLAFSAGITRHHIASTGRDGK